MKRIIGLLMLVSVVGFADEATPPTTMPTLQLSGKTYTARTDDAIVQPIVPPPNMGGAVGANTLFTDKRYNNVRILRITDSTSGMNKDKSFQVSDGGDPNLFSSDSQLFAVKQTGDGSYLYSFDPVAFKATPTSLSFQGDLGFSWNSPRVLFERIKSQVHKITLSQDGKSIVSDVIAYDFDNGAKGSWGTTTNCLPAGYKPLWTGIFVPKRDDASFALAVSTGQQSTGHLVAAYTAGKGCRVYDTTAGTIYGEWGPTGSIDDGSKPLADRFYLHEGGGSQSPDIAGITATGKAFGKSGCLAGKCNADGPYFWEVSTLHVRPCGPYQCDGHAAKGTIYDVTGKHAVMHEYINPSTPLTHLYKGPAFYGDHHGTWNNSTAQDINPIFYTQTLVSTSPVTHYVAPYENEEIAFPVSGTPVVWRFGQNENSGSSPYFAIQNACGVNDSSGSYMIFASDWMQSLGKESDGKTYRGDVFLMELK